MLLTAGCLLLAAGLLLSGSLAWLSKTEQADQIYTVLSDFEVEGHLTFGGQEVVYRGDSVLAPVSFRPTDSNYIGKMKYVVRYTGTSPALIRVRVLEQWTDINTNEVLSVTFLGYNLVSGQAGAAPIDPPALADPTVPAAGPGKDTDPLATPGQWVDNRAADYCYYYSVPVQPKILTASGTTSVPGTTITVGEGAVELTLIDQPLAGDAANAALVAGIDPATTEMGLLIEVEAVQPNRYREFWGIASLPQPPPA